MAIEAWCYSDFLQLNELLLIIRFTLKKVHFDFIRKNNLSSSIMFVLETLRVKTLVSESQKIVVRT